MKDCTLFSIPTELQHQISSFLSASDLQNVGQTCVSLRNIYTPLSYRHCIVASKNEAQTAQTNQIYQDASFRYITPEMFLYSYHFKSYFTPAHTKVVILNKSVAKLFADKLRVRQKEENRHSNHNDSNGAVVEAANTTTLITPKQDQPKNRSRKHHRKHHGLKHFLHYYPSLSYIRIVLSFDIFPSPGILDNIWTPLFQNLASQTKKRVSPITIDIKNSRVDEGALLNMVSTCPSFFEKISTLELLTVSFNYTSNNPSFMTLFTPTFFQPLSTLKNLSLSPLKTLTSNQYKTWLQNVSQIVGQELPRLKNLSLQLLRYEQLELLRDGIQKYIPNDKLTNFELEISEVVNPHAIAPEAESNALLYDFPQITALRINLEIFLERSRYHEVLKHFHYKTSFPNINSLSIFCEGPHPSLFKFISCPDFITQIDITISRVSTLYKPIFSAFPYFKNLKTLLLEFKLWEMGIDSPDLFHGVLSNIEDTNNPYNAASNDVSTDDYYNTNIYSTNVNVDEFDDSNPAFSDQVIQLIMSKLSMHDDIVERLISTKRHTFAMVDNDFIPLEEEDLKEDRAEMIEFLMKTIDVIEKDLTSCIAHPEFLQKTMDCFVYVIVSMVFDANTTQGKANVLGYTKELLNKRNMCDNSSSYSFNFLEQVAKYSVMEDAFQEIFFKFPQLVNLYVRDGFHFTHSPRFNFFLKKYIYSRSSVEPFRLKKLVYNELTESVLPLSDGILYPQKETFSEFKDFIKANTSQICVPIVPLNSPEMQFETEQIMQLCKNSTLAEQLSANTAALFNNNNFISNIPSINYIDIESILKNYSSDLIKKDLDYSFPKYTSIKSKNSEYTASRERALSTSSSSSSIYMARKSLTDATTPDYEEDDEYDEENSKYSQSPYDMDYNNPSGSKASSSEFHKTLRHISYNPIPMNFPAFENLKYPRSSRRHDAYMWRW